MRFILSIVFLHAVLLQGQQAKPGKTCGDSGQGLTTYWYDRAVWEHIQPDGWSSSLIRISISVNAESKLVLMAVRDNFELVRGAPEGNFYKVLDAMDQSCQLALDPSETAKRVRINWQRSELSPSMFSQIHRDFTGALSQYVSNVQARYTSVLRNGGVQMLHAAEFSVVYDNFGFEHLEISAYDWTDDPQKMDPVIKWARGMLKLSEERFRQER